MRAGLVSHDVNTDGFVYNLWWPTVACALRCVSCWLGLNQAFACCITVTLLFVEILKERKERALLCPRRPGLCFAYSHSVCLSASLSASPLISWLGRRLLWHMCLDHVRQQWNYVGRGSSCLWKQPWRPDERLRERTHSSWPSGSQAALHRPNGLASFLFR